MKRIRYSLLMGLALTLAGLPAAAQQQQESVAEAARRARAQKKQPPPADRVWTNDNIPRAPGAVSTVGAGAPSAEVSTTDPRAPRELTPEQQEAEKLRKDTEARLGAERERLTNARRELDLATREHQLLNQQFYGDPAQATDPAGPGRARLEQLAADIETRKREIAEMELQVAALEDELKSIELTHGPRPDEPTTPEQDREAWQARLRPLRTEVERIETELRRIRADAAAQGLSVSGPPGTGGGSMTGDLINQLERRRSELLEQIADLEDQARRAGVPPAWLR